ncbi:MAG: hypothetical protein ACLUI3_07635 [Christensenellales bacterium]
MKATLDALDERLRRLIAQPCGRAARIACAALVLLGFAGVMMTRSLALGHHAATAVMMCLPLAAMLVFAMRIVREHEQGALGALLLGALCAAAMLARVSFLERSSGDYEIYLADWLQKLAGGSFAEGMRQNIGEYNVLYQYILFVITRLPVPSLYAVKAVSFIGDAFLAARRQRWRRRTAKRAPPPSGWRCCCRPSCSTAACSPSATACTRPARSGGWRSRWSGSPRARRRALRCRWHSSCKPCSCCRWSRCSGRIESCGCRMRWSFWRRWHDGAAALLGGKSIGALLSIYTAQTGLYTGLTYNAPSFFALMNTTGLDVYAYGNFGMALAFGACALLVACGVKQAGKLTREGYLRLALLLPLAIVFFLPRMHERISIWRIS